MMRHIKFCVLLALAPSAAATAYVFFYALLGLDFDASTRWDHAYWCTGGMVLGAWIWGGQAS